MTQNLFILILKYLNLKNFFVLIVFISDAGNVFLIFWDRFPNELNI